MYWQADPQALEAHTLNADQAIKISTGGASVALEHWMMLPRVKMRTGRRNMWSLVVVGGVEGVDPHEDVEVTEAEVPPDDGETKVEIVSRGTLRSGAEATPKKALG